MDQETANALGWAERDELELRRAFMERAGYRRCDIPACNCNSWHGGHADQRLAELRFSIGENGKTLLDSAIALRSALEQRTRERDEARGDWKDVPPHNRLIPIAEWQQIVAERDASLGRLMDKLDAKEAELSSLRESAAALGELEKWLREDDHRVVWLGQVIGEGECSCVLYISDEEYEQDDEIGREKGNTLSAAIRSALKAAKEGK